MSNITVSIFMLTYNQETFIAQAIEGVLMQKTNFRYQLVIGEDCSTDKTRLICESFAKKFPIKIKLLPNIGENIGLIANYMRTIKACDGKYIAICDGDDFWIDDRKLQKQVDFLEYYKDFSIVFSKVQRLYPDGRLHVNLLKFDKVEFDFEDLIKENMIPSVVAMFRNNQSQIFSLPPWIGHFPYGDWPTYLWTIRDGSKIGFLDEVTAVYRMDIGVSAAIRQKSSNIIKVNLNILKCILKDETFAEHYGAVYQSILKHRKELMLSYNREQGYFKAFEIFINLLFRYSSRFELLKLYVYSLKEGFKL